MLQVLRSVSLKYAGYSGVDHHGVADILILPGGAEGIAIFKDRQRPDYLHASQWANGKWHAWNMRADPEKSFEDHNKNIADPVGKRIILTGSPCRSNVGIVSKVIPPAGILSSGLEVKINGNTQWCEWGDGLIIEDDQEL